MIHKENHSIKNTENTVEAQELEPHEVYLYNVLESVKNRMSRYFPILYRDIPTKINYKYNSKELKINQDFDIESGKLDINIKTTEDLSNQTAENLQKAETNFLVFKDKAGDQKILKKTQDYFFLIHEYGHGISSTLLKEFRPEMIQQGKEEREKFNDMNEIERLEFQEQEQETAMSILNESISMSLEKMIAEKTLEEDINPIDKTSIKKFIKIKEDSFLSRKLEGTDSNYTELDEALIVYRIYKKLEKKGPGKGEQAIINFAKNFDISKLSQIKRYQNIKQKILSPEYKEFLNLSKNNPALFLKKYSKN